MEENELSHVIIGAALKVHSILGPGLLESVYEAALTHELRKSGYHVNCQRGLPVIYDGDEIPLGFRVDMIVNEKVIIEIKSVETLHDIHYKQLLTYLRLSNRKLGLLINFNSASLKGSMRRVVNGL